jgi:hypothetical protein
VARVDTRSSTTVGKLAKAKKSIKPSLVEVTWHDATSWSGWHSLKDHQASDPLEITSLGYLSKNDNRVVQIVQSRRPEDTPGDEIVAHSLTIPRGWVRRVRRLR